MIGAREPPPTAGSPRSYELLLDAHEQIYAFLRFLHGERWLVILNFTADLPVFALPSTIAFSRHELILSNYPIDSRADPRLSRMQPYEARIYRLDNARHKAREVRNDAGDGP